MDWFNRPAQFIRDDELADKLVALLRASRGQGAYNDAIIDIALAYGLTKMIETRVGQARQIESVIDNGHAHRHLR